MRIITLEEIKAHCRIEEDYEDSMLELYGESAEELVLQLCERTLDDIVETYGGIPANIKHACLMLTAHSANRREPASMSNLYTVPYTLEALIKPYMIL